jgi:hypothetical protein
MNKKEIKKQIEDEKSQMSLFLKLASRLKFGR